MNRLQIEHEKKILELRTQAVEKLRRDSRLDVGLLDLQGRLHSLAPTNRLARKAVYREIAGKLGVSKSAVEKHIASAITILALQRQRE